jgi:hypothetical protein
MMALPGIRCYDQLVHLHLVKDNESLLLPAQTHSLSLMMCGYARAVYVYLITERKL